jgi:hypothetical protein
MLGVTEGKWSAEVTGSGNITKSLTQAGKAATKREWRARGMLGAFCYSARR